VEVLRLPPSSPNLIVYAERLVLSIRSECLDRIVRLGEAHLRRSVSEFVQHYRFERNHQGLANDLIESAPSSANTNGRVDRRERLGGVLTGPTSSRMRRRGGQPRLDVLPTLVGNVFELGLQGQQRSCINPHRNFSTGSGNRSK